MTGLELTRPQVLAFRHRAGALDERLAYGADSLRRAAWAGLQDSMPRAALLSIHARVAGAGPSAWEDPSLVQLWGPRYNVFVAAARDLAVFSLGTLPDDARGRRRAEDLAARLHALLDGARMSYEDAGGALGVHPNRLRYAAPTGTVLMRWEGARRPVVWTVPAPEMDPRAARLELARRYLHVYGPATPAAFAGWAGIGARHGAAAFAHRRRGRRDVAAGRRGRDDPAVATAVTSRARRGRRGGRVPAATRPHQANHRPLDRLAVARRTEVPSPSARARVLAASLTWLARIRFPGDTGGTRGTGGTPAGGHLVGVRQRHVDRRADRDPPPLDDPPVKLRDGLA